MTDEPDFEALDLTVPEFQLSLGCVSGYADLRLFEVDVPRALKWVASAWQEEARKYHDEQGVYVSCVAAPATAVYDTRHGCPPDGEFIVTLTGLYNPKFHRPLTKPAAWKEAVRTISDRMRRRFDQRTAYLTFRDVEFLYVRAQE